MLGLCALVAALWVASGESKRAEAEVAPPTALVAAESTPKWSGTKSPASQPEDWMGVTPARLPVALRSAEDLYPAGFVMGPDGQGHFRRKGAFVQVDGASARISLPHPEGGDGTRYLMAWGIDGGRAVAATPGEALPGRVHEYLGEDAARWRRDLPVHGSLGFEGVLPGARVIAEPDAEGVRYALRFDRASQAAGLSLYYDGVTGLEVDRGGRALVMQTPAGEVREHGLRAFEVQEDGRLREIAARYVARGPDAQGRHRYGFQFGAHRADLGLVIDPTITWTTRVGGDPDDFVHRVAVHSGTGDVFLLGSTKALLPLGPWSIRGAFASGAADMFLARIGASGPHWFAYFGGGGNEIPGGLALDEAGGRIFVYGTTSSTLPTNLYGTHALLPDGILATFDLDGQAAWGRYLGGSGSDKGVDIAWDGANLVAVTNVGSLDFTQVKQTCAAGGLSLPTSCGVNESSCMTYVTQLDPADGSAGQSWSFPAQVTREGARLALDGQGMAYVAGRVRDTGTDPTWNAWVGSVNLGNVAQCAVLSTFGSQGDDVATSVAVSPAGVFAGGWSNSPSIAAADGAPVTAGGLDGFVARINGTTLQSLLFIGGAEDDLVTDLAFAPTHPFVLHFGGGTRSPGIAINGLDSTLDGPDDGLVGEVSIEGGTGKMILTRLSYLGGSGEDLVHTVAARGADVFAAGWSSSADLPGSNNTHAQPGGGGFATSVDTLGSGQVDAGVGGVPGTPCVATSDCGPELSCEGGFCCAESCAGGCQTCQSGTCQVRPAEQVCRTPTSTCDAEEVCDGFSKDCPEDLPRPDGEGCDDGGVCKDGVCQPGGLVAHIVAMPLSGEAPLTVTFDATPSGTEPGAEPSYEWNFGDGSPPAFAPIVTHTYVAPGGYVAELRLRDGRNPDSRSRVFIQVGRDGQKPPTAQIVADVTEGNNALTVSFGCLCSDGSAPLTRWRWELGEGNVVYSESVTHSFEPGQHEVQLEVTDSNGLSARHEVVIRVSEDNAQPPDCAAFASPPAGEVPLEVKLIGKAQGFRGLPLRTRWEVSGGEYDASDVTLPISDPGVRQAAFTAEDSEGLECRSTVWITATKDGEVPPVIEGSANAEALCGQPWAFSPTARSMGQVSWSGDMPEGMTLDPATGALSWTPAPAQQGRHAVKVQAQNRAGSDEERFEVEVLCPELVYETGWGCALGGREAGTGLWLLLLGAAGGVLLRSRRLRRRRS